MAEEEQQDKAQRAASTDSRRGGRGGRRNDRKDRRNEARDSYVERVVSISRVSKTVKGGRRISFSALVVVGDGNGTVGVGYGKAKEVPAAIAKGTEDAKKNMFHVNLLGTTIPHLVIGEAGAGRVLLRPASEGTGVIAGGAVRALMEAAGVRNVLTKVMGSSNAANVVYATVAAMKMLEEPEAVASRRGLPLEHVAPESMLRMRAAQEAREREEKEAQALKAENEAAAAGVGA
ncbi:MAG: 30S ribosomal protein S5 [Actinomycetaceae bacterium]|nr:30S ribosomal protein S5 [Actinomycetaceae bacterium]MDY6082845.1 30S ribosomal protein S5 [Actinomycetaceae bacterium]